MTADDREKARRLIAEHVEQHRRVPGQWAGYPGICLICYQHEVIEELTKTLQVVEQERRRTVR